MDGFLYDVLYLMEKTKVIKVLKTFKKVELNRFDKYIRSPFYNVHVPTILLWESLYEGYPEFDGEELQKENLFARVFPGECFNDAKLSVVRNNLLKQLFGFLSRIRLDLEEHTLNRELLNELSNRKLDDFLPRLIEDARNKLEERTDLSYDKYLLEDFVADYNLTRNNRSLRVDFQSVMDHLDTSYLVSKLKYIGAMMSRQRLLAVKYDITFLEEVWAYCEANELEDKPLVQAYYLSSLLFNPNQLDHLETSDNAFQKLRELLPNQDFRKDDQTNLFGFLITYCNEQYKAGRLAYLKEMFHLYRIMLEKDLLFESSMISSVHYRNIVSIALKLKEYDWADDFIHSYRDKIEVAYADSLYHYNLARLYFSRRRFQEVLPHLQKFTPIDAINKLRYNQLLMETYYECDEEEGFFSLCVSFRTYIRRSKSLSENYKTAYLNFISFSKKLFQIKINPLKKFSPEQIQEEFQSMQLLEDRGWLEEKLAELMV